MCNCVVEWKTDEEAPGDHTQVPVTCKDKELELLGRIDELKRQVSGQGERA